MNGGGARLSLAHCFLLNVEMKTTQTFMRTLGHSKELPPLPGRKYSDYYLAQSEHKLLQTAILVHEINTKKLAQSNN